VNEAQRIEEWTAFVYRLHLRKIGTLPDIEGQERIRRALRTLVIRFLAGEAEAWQQIVEKYGSQRQAPRRERSA
jgi:hypothetical protein